MNIDDKILILENYLRLQNGSYSDNMKEELYLFFFINEGKKDFLETLSTKSEITNKIDFIINKMIMLEDQEELSDIIECSLFL